MQCVLISLNISPLSSLPFLRAQARSTVAPVDHRQLHQVETAEIIHELRCRSGGGGLYAAVLRAKMSED